MSTENTIVDDGNRIIIYDELAESVIHGYPEDADEGSEEFAAAFEIVKSEQGLHFANPTDSFYQGVQAMRVIRRKADSKLFGFDYWKPIAKYDEFDLSCNGDENGLEFDVPDGFDWNNDYYPRPFVFLPVEPFIITGYKITTGATK